MKKLLAVVLGFVLLTPSDSFGQCASCSNIWILLKQNHKFFGGGTSYTSETEGFHSNYKEGTCASLHTQCGALAAFNASSARQELVSAIRRSDTRSVRDLIGRYAALRDNPVASSIDLVDCGGQVVSRFSIPGLGWEAVRASFDSVIGPGQ